MSDFDSDMVEKWNTDVVYWTGVAALIPQAWLNFMSIGPIRLAEPSSVMFYRLRADRMIAQKPVL